MTAGERLRALAGAGGTAATLLLLIGSGATTGDALANYSGLSSGTAAEHLLTDAQVTAGYSQEIELHLGDIKPRPRPPSVELDELAEHLSELDAKRDVLTSERKQVTRQKKNAKIRSEAFYELQTYEHLLALEITQLEASRSELEARLQALRAISDRLAWQEQIAIEQANEQAMMMEMDMAFVMTMMMEA